MECPRCGYDSMKRSGFRDSDYNLSYCRCDCPKCGTKITYKARSLKSWCV